MSKVLLVGGFAAAAALGGAAYYVSDYAVPDLDTPPVLAKINVTDAYAKLAAAPFPTELGDLNRRDRLGEAGIEIREAKEDGKLLAWTLAIEDVPYFTVRTAFAPSGVSQSTIDVKVTMHDSPVTKAGYLHPFDIKLLTALLDLGITDYAASVVEGRPPRSWNKLGDRLMARLYIDENEKRAMGVRFQVALLSTISSLQLRAGRSGSADGPSMMESGGDAIDAADVAMSAAEAAADAASDATEDHGIWRGRPIDPRDTMRQSVQPSTTTRPMVDVER
jgi:hypothetical protein